MQMYPKLVDDVQFHALSGGTSTHTYRKLQELLEQYSGPEEFKDMVMNVSSLNDVVNNHGTMLRHPNPK